MVALFLRPDADQSDGSWLNESASATNLFNSVDEPTTPSDTDYIVSSTTDGDKVRLRLSDPSGGVVAPLIIRYRCKRTGTQAANLIGRLYQGTSPGTLRATFTQLSVPDTFTTYTYTLTSAEFTSITDFTDLYVEFELSQQSSLKVDLNFAGGVYYDSGTVADATGVLSCTRASSGYATNADGTITSFGSNTLRIGVGTGLLIEDSKTNLLTNSQAMAANFVASGIPTADQYAAFGSSLTMPGGTITGPEGTSSMEKVSFGATSANIGRRQSISASTTYTFSVWLATASGTFKLKLSRTNTLVWDPTMIGPEITITTTPTRFSFTYTTGASDTQSDLNAGAEGATPYNIPATGDVYMFGWQHEVGSFPSSYIPTTGSTVTRADDLVTCTGNLNTLLTALPQSTVIDVKTLVTPFQQCLLIGDADAVPGLNFPSGNTTGIWSGPSFGSGPSFTMGGSVTWSGGAKAGYAQNSGAISIVGGGGTIGSDSVNQTVLPSGPLLGCSTSIHRIDGYIRRATFWNSKLADATLQGFTAP